jgi:energy-coupling factor transporter transmembrane protein EcfT
VAAPERPSTPLWWYGLVGLAALLTVLWVVRIVVGFVLGLVKVAILLILAVALVSWVLGKKAER